MAEPDRLPDLGAIEAAIWQELTRAAHDSHHDWRSVVLATTALDADGAPCADARTVVLREVDAEAKQLVVYTDSRAAKVTQLLAAPTAALVMWSKRLSWQLRCRATCTVADTGLAVSSRWARVRLSPTAQDYLSPRAPGSALDLQTPAVAHREYFAVISASVLSIDWLELHRDGHRRAVFATGGAGARARWLQP